VFRVRVSDRAKLKANMLPGLGCEDAPTPIHREQGPNSMVTHGGTSTSEPRVEGLQGRSLFSSCCVVVVAVSSSRCSSTQRFHNHAHTHTKGGCRRKTNASSDAVACEERRICRWPSANARA
jgi:hypothetical protein